MGSQAILKKFLDIFKGGEVDINKSETNAPSESDQLTNKRLLAELSSHFRSVLEIESVGQRMLYPMSFNILMNQSDYEDRKQALPFVLPEVISAFYGIIREMREVYPNYTPPAKYWYFQFVPCKLNTVQHNDNTTLIVQKGHITTIASLLTFDIKGVQNSSMESNTRVSIKVEGSNVMHDVNINWEAIKEVDLLAESTFTYNFDKTLNSDAQNIKATTVADAAGIAELSYSLNGQNYHYIMLDNLIHISGNNEKRKGRAFFILNSENILDDHIQIRYTPSENKFQLATFGPARLNSSKLNESNNSEMYWYDLANNSSIFINDEISVKFKVK